MMAARYQITHTCPYCQHKNIALLSLSPVHFSVLNVECEECEKKYMIKIEVEPKITPMVPCPGCKKPKFVEDEFCSRCTGEY